MNNQFIIDETDLHIEVVKFIQTNYPDLLIDGGLGEFQDTLEKRIEAWEKEYTKGKPDLLIFNHSGHWKGFAIEFKRPRKGGVLTKSQFIYLEKLETIGWKTLVSQRYSKCVREIISYCKTIERDEKKKELR